MSFGASEGQVIQSTSDAGVLGVSGIRGAEAGARVDVYLSDIQDIECGALVTAGDYVTADAEGKAIPAAPAADAQMQVVGPRHGDWPGWGGLQGSDPAAANHRLIASTHFQRNMIHVCN